MAIKILPQVFAADADRVARFQREARTLASLDHPNIAIIHGLEQAGDVHALVMELVPGDDLSQRIVGGAIPIDEALAIAKQIAEALAAAHERGIIHRDLKPANIKVRADGTRRMDDRGRVPYGTRRDVGLQSRRLRCSDASRHLQLQHVDRASRRCELVVRQSAGALCALPRRPLARDGGLGFDWPFHAGVRPLDSRGAQALAGTEGATYPFWSADSRFIAFLAQNKLKKIGVAGGEVVTLCDASFGSSGAWSRDDVILFTPNGNSPLYRVSASGGTPTQVTTLEAASGDVQHSFPFFLPDGRHFLYFVVGSQASRTVPRGVYVGPLDSTKPGKLIEPGGSNAKYANGYLIFLRNGALLAQPFDVGRLELGGAPSSLVDHIETTGTSASDVAGAFTVSETGVLAYQTGSVVRSQLTWFDRAGTRLATLGDQADYVDVALSPDDTRVAVSLMDLEIGTRDLWILDVARRLGERFTYESGDDFGPNWSRPGGDRIFFSSQRQGSIDLYEKPSSGSGSETLLLKDDLGKFNASASPDGRFLVYVGGGGVIQQSDIWVLPLSGERQPAPFLESRFMESQGQFSPDGRWVAFMSTKSGKPQVYVTAFPGRDTEQQVSTAGGGWPRWNRNGKELFYLALDNTLSVTPVNGQTSRFDVGTGRPLFTIHPRPARVDAYPYDVTADGQRVLVNTFVEEVTPPITLIVNWAPKR